MTGRDLVLATFRNEKTDSVPWVPFADAKQITDRYNIVIAGNIPPASVMLFGCQQDNMKVTLDLLDSVGDTTNLIVSPGCDMPYDVPPEKTVGCEQAVHQTEQTRELVANYSQSSLDIPIDLPDYTTLSRPLVEYKATSKESIVRMQKMGARSCRASISMASCDSPRLSRAAKR